MQAAIAKWGNSAAVRLPQQLLNEIAVVIGDKFEVKLEGNKIILIPVKQKPSLDALLARITDENKHDEQIPSIQGKELL